jgi:hypothetical protein
MGNGFDWKPTAFLHFRPRGCQLVPCLNGSVINPHIIDPASKEALV